ncbi:MAG: enolase C-terminal domain-like protein, partial [Planctomycetaceae bacterium]|nr:enolase C-terminal domain-like protein [Planctomycetaceae bacterium]
MSAPTRTERQTALDRRDWLKFAAAGLGFASCGASQSALAQEPPQVAGGGRLTITDVRAIVTQPSRSRLVVVKVQTSDPGLYGVGCATFTQRARLVEAAVNQYLRPFLLGKDPTRIEDIAQSGFVSSYWRNGPVLNNALSGVDQALWDILGKRAGLPLYQLFGGKARDAVDTYVHASGETIEDVQQAVATHRSNGFRHVRVQVGVPGLSTYGATATRRDQDDVPANRRTQVWEPAPYVRIVPRLFEHLRHKLGEEIELLHDIHERTPPILAIQLVKSLEQYRPYFVEDPFSPEDVGYFSVLRQQTATPIAMGELFNNPNEWLPLVSGRLIDFIRCHVSQVGGISAARKIAALCEAFAVRTAWHGPGDTSPVGHAAHVHLDLS